MRRKMGWALAVLIVLLLCSMIPQRVLATTHGDFTGDGKIGSQDAIYLLRHVLNPQEYGVDQSADVNGDGKVNTKDALHLLRHALNPQAYPVVENHEPVTIPGQAASCTVDGLTDGSYCAVCEKILQEQTVIPARAHTPGEFVGTGEYCGSRELGSAACTDCGQIVYSVEHTLHTTTNLPTCTENGSVVTTCANCDYSASSPIAAGGHSAGQWEITRDASCTAAGEKVRKCVDCAAVVDTGVVPKRDHETVAEVSGNSCTYTCHDCDHTETVSIENKWKVSFVTGCDPELAVIYVEPGQIPTLPTPILENYSFMAWYADESYTVLYEGTPITADTTLYAMWEPKNITASDNGYQGIIRGADTDYQFVVKSPIALTSSNLADYITVTSSVGEVMEIFVAGSQGDRYYIGGHYAAGDIYEAVATDGILFEESGADPLWFVVTGEQRENVAIKDEVVKLNKDQFFGEYSDETYDYMFASEDLLKVGQLVVITGENSNDLYAIYEVVGVERQGSRYRYQCVIPDPEDVLSEVDLFSHITVDMSTVELQEGWEDAVIQSVRGSRAYAAFQDAANTYAMQRSANDSKYTYSLSDLDIKTTRKKAWSSSTGRNEMLISVEISCKLERRNKTGGGVVDISTVSMTLENRFSADADVSASGILGGDARVVLTTHNTVTADFVLKLGFMDDDDSQEEYFRNLYKNALDKKDLLPIDTVPEGQETMVPAFYLPIPLGAGFALDIDGYVMLDWEVCGEFGVSVQFNNTMSFGFELRDWNLKTVAYHNNTVSMHAYLAGKMRAAAGIRPEIGLSWAKVVRAGANVTVAVYAESGGLVGFTVSNKKEITPQRAGYFEVGLNLKAQLFGEIGWKWLNYSFDYTLFDQDYPVFTIGTKKMPLGFESDGEEYIIYMDYDSTINLLDQVDVILRSQSLGTMEIDRGLPEKCFFALEESMAYVSLSSDGALSIRGCTKTEFDLNIRITSGTVYKNIIVHIRIDHTHEYTTTYYPGSCTEDEYNFHECDNCTYEYREVLTEAPGHDYSQYIVDRVPTCLEDGQHHGFCARCGLGSTEVIPALGHDYSLQIQSDAHLVRAATCQNPACYYYVCVNCGGHNANRTYEYGGLADHSYQDPYTCHDRACTTKGCSHISYATTAHPFTDWIHVEPGGCCEEGYDIRSCRDCGYTETTLGSNVIKQHDWQLMPAKAPTCAEAGYQDYIVCVVCGQVANKTVVPTLDHILLYKDITGDTHVAYCHRAGCDYESQPVTHTHTGWTVVYPAECEKEGLEHGFCVCGHVGSKPITALEHQHSAAVTKPATCTEDGVKTYTCRCGDTYTEAIPAKGHTSGSAVVENQIPATCTANGSYDEVVYCSACHTELSRKAKTVTKLGHQNGTPKKENETNSTCQTAGSYDTVVYCTRCHIELSRDTQSKPLIACKPGVAQIENETNSTCTAHGSYDTVTYCTMCGGELSRETTEKPLAQHTPGSEQIENETESTCAAAGQYDVVTYCTVCKTELSRDTKYKPLAQHTPGAVQVENETESTCAVAGQYDAVVFCTACGKELSRDTKYKPLAQHTPGAEQIENETNSTCAVAGQYDVVTYCTVCKTEQSRKTEYKPLIDCVPGPEKIENETDSTCTVAGRYDVVVYCTMCGEEMSRRTEDKPLADHTPGPEQIENADLPACEKEGRHDVARYCTVCGAETSRVTVSDAALSHDAKNAATEYDGEYHWKVCAREGCGAILEKTRHNGTWVVESYSTCSENGVERYHCGCGYETSRKLALADHDHTGPWLNDSTQHYRVCTVCRQQIDAESHDYSGKMLYDHEQHYHVCSVCGLRGDLGYHIPVPNGETKPVTCTEDGYTPYKCPTCDYQWNGDIVIASGHDWSTELTFDDTFHYYPCRNCGEPEPSTMNGHTTQIRITVKPTCTEPGYQYTDCVICGHSVGQSLDPLDHDTWSGPTEYDDTYHWIICGRTGCGAVLNKTGHRHNAGTPVKPTCTEDGYTVYSCTCGHRYEADFKDALGHSGMEIWRESDNGDRHYHACDRDGCNYETDWGTHSYGQWQTVIPETCSAYGTRERYCTVCNEVETDDRVPMLPHNVYESVKTETVKITGGVEYHHYVVETCRDCDYSSKIGETVVSSHAEIVPLSKVWPTCTESGWETGWNCAVPGCTDPSHSRPQVQIPALGHNEVDGYCTRCGAKNNDLQFTLNSEGDSYRVTGIGNCTDTDIRIPAIYKGLPVTMIGTSAFAGNKTITSVYIPDTVDTIMWYAFYQCSNLTQVHIPNSVTSLGGYAFFGCTNLTSIDLPDNLTAIHEYTFYGCTALGAIEIPANVTTIDRYAFQGCSSLTSVTIPGNVTQIGKSAFERCRGLTRIDIPLSVTSIGDTALYNCTALEYIYYAGSTAQWAAITKGSLWDSSCTYTLICLGDPAGSQGLAYTLSGDGTYYIVSGIGTCTDTQIVIPETYQGLPVKEIGICAFDTKEHEIPIETVVIPDSVITIGRYAFRGNASLYSVTLGNAVQTIGDHAFDTCSELKNIDLPSSLTAIGSYALPNLYTVNIPANVTSLGEFAFLTQNGAWVDAANMNYSSDAYGVLFNKDKTRLITAPQLLAGSYTIPNTVTSMDMYAFGGCTGLTEITIPYGVSTIEQSVFSGCTGLKTVTIAKDVTTIGWSAFGDCTNLQTIYFEGTTAQWEAITKASYWNQNCPAQVICLGDINGSQGLAYELNSDGTYYIVTGIGTCTDTELVIPDTYMGKPVKEIGDGAFVNVTTIQSVTMSAGVTRVGRSAFALCSGLQKVVLPEGVQSIGDSAFDSCLQLQSVSVSGGLKVIEDYAFRGCESLKAIIFPEGLETIGKHAFIGCKALKEAIIPDSVTSIGDTAFGWCESLEYVHIPTGITSIGMETFAYNYSLNFVDIPSNVKSIGDYAFFYCTGMEKASFETGLTSIGNYAFACCESLRVIIIPEGVTSIGTDVFSCCWGLEEATLPISLTEIASYTFYDCSSLEKLIYNGTSSQWIDMVKGEDWDFNCPYTLICLGYPTSSQGLEYNLSSDGTYYIVTGIGNCTDTEIVIPGTYQGMPVRQIGTDALSGCTSLKSIEIPAGVTTIGYGAFERCGGLTSITIPNSVTTIGDCAFGYCSGLTSVVIPDSVTTIGYYAFAGCSNLTSITVGSGVSTIGEYAFSDCTALQEINFNATAMKDCEPGDFVFLAAGQNGNGITVNIGANVTRIPAALFYNEGLGYDSPDNHKIVRVVFAPDSVCTTIGGNAFEYCIDLSSVTLGNNLTTIGSGAFFYCTKLTNINLPDCLVTIGDDAFSRCSSLTSIVIPDSVTTIGDYAFSYCKSMTSIEISNSVTTIGFGAFGNCYSLGNIEIPAGVTTIGEWAFYNCKGLISIEIPNSVTTIGDYAFNYCTGMTEITIPTSVTTIGEEAFGDCTNLQTIYFEGTSAQWEAITKASYWNQNCPAQVICLGDPTGSQGLAYTLSGDGTYYIVSGIGDCTDTQILIPETYQGLPVKEIGADAFSNCTGITSIFIPEGVTTIGQWAFNQCTGLTEITIPQSATTLGNYLFYGCTSLKEVALPNGVTAVITYMFYNCTGLERVEIPESVTTIGSFAFYNCTSLKWVEIPAKVKTIGSQAFCNSGLTSLVIPDSVTVIGTQAFSGCTGLMEVTLSENLTQIGTQVFYNCTSLTKITIPAKVTSISTRAFAGCTGLTEITIPVSVTSINSRALQGCTGMQTIYFEGTTAQWEAITKKDYWNQNCPAQVICLGDYDPRFAFELSADETYYIVYGTNELSDAHVVIPSMYWGKPVKEIGDFAFGYNTMTAVTIPATIERINDEAFTECYDLTAVYITDIEAWCRIEFGEYNANPLAYARNLYLNGALVQNLQIPGTVSYISDGAFEFCDSLVTVTIGNGVTSIGYGAFFGCQNLTRVDIPASVTSIGAYAFHVDYGTKLAGIWVDAQNPNYSSDAYGVLFNKDKTVLIRAPHAISGTYTIPSTVQYIEADAFNCCDNLRAIIMGKNVVQVGEWAFDCWDLDYTYYCGSVDDWNAMDIGTANNTLYQTVRYYSETRPAEYVSEYWHYVNGVPTLWS